jgi:hypothetical protein
LPEYFGIVVSGRDLPRILPYAVKDKWQNEFNLTSCNTQVPHIHNWNGDTVPEEIATHVRILKLYTKAIVVLRDFNIGKYIGNNSISALQKENSNRGINDGVDNMYSYLKNKVIN